MRHLAVDISSPKYVNYTATFYGENGLCIYNIVREGRHKFVRPLITSQLAIISSNHTVFRSIVYSLFKVLSNYYIRILSLVMLFIMV